MSADTIPIRSAALLDDYANLVPINAARTITAQHSFSPGSDAAPFTLGAHAQGQLVTGLNADLLDGHDAAYFVAANAGITGATKTKVTYDAKGLVTAGADATTADIADSTDKRYVTDAQLVVIGNTSGVNTGNQTITLTGDVTGSGTGSFAATIPNDTVTYAKFQNLSATSRLLGRKTASAGDVEECTLSEVLDFIGSAARGDILYRGTSTWTRLAAGTSGMFLRTAGTGADPGWATITTGTLAPVALTPSTSVEIDWSDSSLFTLDLTGEVADTTITFTGETDGQVIQIYLLAGPNSIYWPSGPGPVVAWEGEVTPTFEDDSFYLIEISKIGDAYISHVIWSQELPTVTTVASDTLWDAKGDLAVGTGANTAAKLAVGTNGYVLTADSGETTGLKWAAAGDVTAAATFATDNSILRADGTGKGAQATAANATLTDAGVATLTGLNVGADTDVSALIGRTAIGHFSSSSDYASMAHYDQRASAGGYAFLQNSSGATNVNSASGQTLSLCINNSSVQSLTASLITLSTKLKVKASYADIVADSDGATITFDLNAGNVHAVTLGGNRTLALSNATPGQKFCVRLKQDGTGSRTVTWWSTISWAGGSAPTLTTTANKADLIGFLCTGSGTYDGFVLGMAI